MKKIIKLTIIAVVAVLFVNYGAWPIEKEPAPSLSLASAWICEQFANGMGIEVERSGLKVAAVNPRYHQYRLDFIVDGAWQIKGTISVLILLLSYSLLTGHFSGLGFLTSLVLMVFYHIVRLVLISIFPIIGSFDFIDNATRMGYVVCTALSAISVLTLKLKRIRCKLEKVFPQSEAVV